MKKINRVLLVDDAANNYLHMMLLKQMDFVEHIEVTFNGKEAIEYMSSCNLEDLPNLILLDIHMPYMSGFDFLESFIRLDEKRQRGVNLLMVTASLDPEDKVRIEKYKNVIELVNKPLTSSKIIEVWEKCLID